MTKIPEEAVERMEALVRSMVANPISANATYDEARAIVAMLPEPVDPLLVEAREHAASRASSAEYAARYRAGEMDSQDIIRGYLFGARAQQAKLTPTAEPDADGWIKHTPGDPMPCDGDTLVDFRLRSGKEFGGIAGQTLTWDRWGDASIIAWRPAR